MSDLVERKTLGERAYEFIWERDPFGDHFSQHDLETMRDGQMSDPRLNADMIRDALKAAVNLIVAEVWAPPVSESEKDRRFRARDDTQRMCLEALHELNRLYPGLRGVE